MLFNQSLLTCLKSCVKVWNRTEPSHVDLSSSFIISRPSLNLASDTSIIETYCAVHKNTLPKTKQWWIDFEMGGNPCVFAASQRHWWNVGRNFDIVLMSSILHQTGRIWFNSPWFSQLHLISCRYNLLKIHCGKRLKS